MKRRKQRPSFPTPLPNNPLYYELSGNDEDPPLPPDVAPGTIGRVRLPVFVLPRGSQLIQDGRLMPPGSLLGVVRVTEDGQHWLVENADGLQAEVRIGDLTECSTLEQMAFHAPPEDDDGDPA